MKNTFLLATAALFFSAAQAQNTSTDTLGNTGNTGSTGTMGNTTTGGETTKKLNAYGSYSTRDSIAAKYKLLPMPAPLTQEKAFPVLGSYQLTTNAGTNATGTYATTGNNTSTTTSTTTSSTTDIAVDSAAMPMVTITMDSASKGIVWVEGLPQGKMKAFLKKSPATYRIIAQKTESGTSVPEGTLHLDQATNTLQVALGTPYNEADPTGVFVLSEGTTPEDNTAEVKVKTKNKKAKSKVTFFTATKVDAAAQMQNTQEGSNNFNNSLNQATNSGQ